jgi:hypothetical protein
MAPFSDCNAGEVFRKQILRETLQMFRTIQYELP